MLPKVVLNFWAQVIFLISLPILEAYRCVLSCPARLFIIQLSCFGGSHSMVQWYLIFPRVPVCSQLLTISNVSRPITPPDVPQTPQTRWSLPAVLHRLASSPPHLLLTLWSQTLW